MKDEDWKDVIYHMAEIGLEYAVIHEVIDMYGNSKSFFGWYLLQEMDENAALQFIHIVKDENKRKGLI